MIKQVDYVCQNPNCNKPFKSRNKNRKYCCKRCKYDTMIGQPRHPNTGKKKTKVPTKFYCENCEQPFERMVYPSSRKRKQFRFCSPSCRNKARKWDGPTRHYSQNWKTCPVCGDQNWREGDYCHLHRPRGNNKYPVRNPIIWSDERIEFLKQNYSSMGGKEVGRILELNPKQVINKANALGLKLNKAAAHRIIHSQAQKHMTENNPMKQESTRKKVLQYWIDHPEENQIKQEKLALGKQRIQRDKPTKLELKLFGYLSELGISFEPFHLVKPRFIVDARIGNLIIQADGDYWHGHPRFENLTERQKKQQARDIAQDKYLTACGYKVVRIWESDMCKDLVIKTLKDNGII